MNTAKNTTNTNTAAHTRAENQEKKGARQPDPIYVSVMDYRNGRHLGLAALNWRAYDIYFEDAQDGVLDVPAGEWLTPDDLTRLQIAADHSVYFELS